MSKPKSLTPLEVVRLLQSLRVNIQVKNSFKDQVHQIDGLMKNDKTGMVTTILDFMTHSATVPMKIETNNETLNNLMSDWQTKFLNRDINIDIPGGMRELSTQYFRERFRSSMIALKVKWGTVDFGANGKFEMPVKMWFLNGGAIRVEDNGALNTKSYSIFNNDNEKVSLGNSKNESIFIRKPYSSWYENYPTPYLVRRGALFNALMKNAITQKQSDLIESIVPYLFQIKAGTDTMAQYVQELLPDEEEMKKLKDQIIDSKEKWNETRDLKELIATLRYDVNLEHLIPDLTKFLNSSITNPIDKNLLASLGMIELQGFASNRQETILNPKVLIEEVKDAVLDWASLLEDIMFEMLRRNEARHRNLSNNDLIVVPGTIKAFITDDMRSMLRSLYDRGLISKKRATEDIAEGVNFEVEIDRRDKENKENLDKRMKPPVIQNLEQYIDPELEDEDKNPGSPEADNFNQAVIDGFLKGRKHNYDDKKKNKEEVTAPYNTIDELPDNVKSVLPVGAQMIWLKAFNSVLEETGDEERAIRSAWSAVSKKYKKVEDKKKWVKK